MLIASFIYHARRLVLEYFSTSGALSDARSCRPSKLRVLLMLCPAFTACSRWLDLLRSLEGHALENKEKNDPHLWHSTRRIHTNYGAAGHRRLKVMM